MNVPLINDLASHIRRVDGGNRLSAYELGEEVNDFLYRRSLIDADQLSPVNHFVVRTNPDKRMGAGALAEAIVAEFELGEVDR